MVQLMTDDEKRKLAHEALLKEMHKADDLVEKHSQLVIAITGAAFGFAATQLDKPRVVYFVVVLGVIVAFEWICKIVRHRQIFIAARNQLIEVENALELPFQTVRPLGKERLLFSFNGFTILLWFAFALILTWGGLFSAVKTGWFNTTPMSASQVIESVSKELPAITGVKSATWNVLSLQWNNTARSYELVLDSGSPSGKWDITYSTSERRLTRAEKQ